MVESLLAPGSAGYVLLAYSLVIFVGMYLGNISLGGIKPGVVLVLFTGFAADWIFADLPFSSVSFVRDFGIMLFMYLIGLQVGPSFFATFKTGGTRNNALMILGVSLSIATMLALYWALSDTMHFPELLGSYFGAVTNTPGLAAAEEVISHFNYAGTDLSVMYACAYPVGFVCLLLTLSLLRLAYRIDPAKEDRLIFKEALKDAPVSFHVTVTNPRLSGMTISQVRNALDKPFIVSRLKRAQTVMSPKGVTMLAQGDVLLVVSGPSIRDDLIAFFGRENTTENLAAAASPIVSRILVMTRPKRIGFRLKNLHLSKLDGVNITRVYRAGVEFFPNPNLHLQLGDQLLVVGEQAAIERLAAIIGNEVKRLVPSLGTIFAGIFAGILFGAIPMQLPDLPVPLRLGIAGGPLVVGLFVGRFGPAMRMNTYVSNSANELLRNIGMALFLASIGLSSGESFVDMLVSGRAFVFMTLGAVISLVPALTIAFFARSVLKCNFHVISGVLAGMCTNTPFLAYCSSLSERNSPAAACTSVYPMTMFLRIVSAQFLVTVFWGMTAS